MDVDVWSVVFYLMTRWTGRKEKRVELYLRLPSRGYMT